MIFLKNIIKDNDVIIKPILKDKKQLFNFLAEKAEELGYIDNKSRYLNDLWERENKMSTEIAKGIAIPHVKSTSVIKDFILVIISQKGIKYDGFSSKVNIIFAIGTNPKGENYLNIMAKVARFLNKKEFKEKILNADVPQDVIKLIHDFENAETVEIQKEAKQNYLVCLIINNADSIDTAEEILLEAGLRNPTIIDTEYGINKIMYNIPFLRSFMLYGANSAASKTIFGFTSEKDFISKVIGVLKNEGIDLEKRGQGTIFAFKLMEMVGGIDEKVDI